MAGWHNLLVTRGSYLHLKHDQLVVRTEEKTYQVPVEDLGSVILESPQITATAALLARLAAQGTAVLTCDAKHMPNGMLHGFSNHSRQLPALQAQVSVGRPLQKRLWQSIVRQKVRNQAAVMEALLGRSAAPLYHLAKSVRSGDVGNLEGQAARIYFGCWPDQFLRHGGGWLDAALDYAYAVVRAALARHIAAYGLHPAIGLFHHNQFNAYNLADDLIEPFRPMVDAWVLEYRFSDAWPDGQADLSIEDRAHLVRVLQLRTGLPGAQYALQYVAEIVVQSLARALREQASGLLVVPDILLPVALHEPG